MTQTAAPAPTTDARGWAKAHIDAWSAHDSAAVTATMTEDVSYTDVALGQTFEGRDAVAGYVAGLTETFSTDHRFELGEVAVDGDTFAVEWVLTGTNDRADDELGLPATGRPFRIPGVSMGRLRDGLISASRSYWDMAGYLTQVGLMPAPDAPATDAG